MQQEAELELGGVRTRQADAARDLDSVGSDPLSMLAGVGVACLDGIGQCADGVAVGARQLMGQAALLLERLPQVGGVALELKFLVGSLALPVRELGLEPGDLLDQLSL